MGDYESTMTGFMDRVTDDMSLAREWANRIGTDGADRWMNEATAGRLLAGLRTQRFRDMVAVSMFASDAGPARWVDAVRGSDMAALFTPALTDPAWHPDGPHLRAMVSDLSWLSKSFPGQLDPRMVCGLSALAFWLVADMNNAAKVLRMGTSDDLSDEYAVIVGWLLRTHTAPAWADVKTWPDVADAPDPVDEYRSRPSGELAGLSGVDWDAELADLERFDDGLDYDRRMRMLASPLEARYRQETALCR